MRTLTYLITLCLLIISSQVFSQTQCEPGFLEADVASVICAQDGYIDLTVVGSGNYTYAWTGPLGFTSTSEDIENLDIGTYSVVVTDTDTGEACFEFYTIDGIIPIGCSYTVVNSECDAGTGSITGSCDLPQPVTYAWSNGATTPNVDGLVPGTYTLTVTDGNLCEHLISHSVTTLTNCGAVHVYPVQATVGNQIRVDFTVEQFIDIVSLQYTIQFDENKLKFDDVGNFNPLLSGLNAPAFGTILADEGYVPFSWFNSGLVGINLDDGAIIYSLYFTALSSEDSEVYINGTPTPMEASNGNFQTVEIITSPVTVLVEGNLLSGTVYNDVNNNCQNDSEQGLPFWIVEITDGTDVWNVATNEAGNYHVILDDGAYTINATSSTDYWSTCNPNETIDLTSSEVMDIGAVALIDCAIMEVDIALPLLRRCFENTIYGTYCNIGTITAADAYVVVELDPFMVYESSTISPTTVDGNILTFDLGDVEIGECGNFNITVTLDQDCQETVLGQTHCTSATIFPNNPCNVDPLWDGSSLALTGTCDGTNATFTIENVGTQDMTVASKFIVIEDLVMGMSVPEEFILGAGEQLDITRPANGTTYYFSLLQTPNHPGESNPAVAIEACGTDANGNFSLGMVTQHGQDDADSFVDIECVENIGSYDPNDKAASIKGFGEEHFISANRPMEYLIRFQNTGTDTAFNIVIEDELSPYFDLASIRPGVSSHDYTFDIEDERKLVFSFDNIMLPDSNVNLAGSNGFISYTVNQIADNPDGTVLENTADIFFDFNEAIVTNTTYHTIGTDYIPTSTFEYPDSELQNSIAVYPNPSTDLMTFELETLHETTQLEVYNLTGKLIMTKSFQSEKINLTKELLGDGMYFYSITSKGNLLTSGKFIFF